MKNQKRITAIMILSAFMLVGCSSKEDTQAIAELQSTVDDLQSQLDEYSVLKSELDSANKSIEEMQSQLEAITAEKDAMASKLEALYYIEAMDETMYVISEANIYDDLYDGLLKNEAAGVLPAEQEIKVTGKSNIIDWYRVEWGDGVVYVAGSLLGDKAPAAQSSGGGSGSGGNGGGSSQQPSDGDGTSQPSGGGSTGGRPSQSDIDAIFGGNHGGATYDPDGTHGGLKMPGQ